MKICICNSQVPFASGGAELHVETLRRALLERGFEAETVTLPFSWHDKVQLVESALAWRMVDLRGATGAAPDLVIATRFPSYLVRHPNKVVWLIHQFRQAYDLLGTPWGDFDASPEHRRALEMIRSMDAIGFGEAREIFTNAGNTAKRLAHYNGFEGVPLYPPPPLGDRYRQGPFGNYVLSVGRLDSLKRFDLLLRTLAACETPVRACLAGGGPEREALERLAAELGVAERVAFLGPVTDDDLVALYAGALAVFYAPRDEDFGYVTIEAFRSGKPVLTASDSGGPLEFVVDGENGVVADPGSPRRWAEALDVWYADRDVAAALGARGRERVRDIGWDEVILSLTGYSQAP